MGRDRRSGRPRRTSGMRCSPAGPPCRAAPAPRAGSPVPDSQLPAPGPREHPVSRSGRPARGGRRARPRPSGCRAATSSGRPSGRRRVSRARAGGTRHRPRPPAEVQARTRRRTRRGCRTVSSWATMPPKDTPTTRQSSQPTGVEERRRVVGEIGHGGGPGRHAPLPEAALLVEEQLEGVGQGPSVSRGWGAQVTTHQDTRSLYPRPGRSRQVRRRAPCGTQPSYSG